MDIWYNIQWQIEQATNDGTSLSGLVLDLVKCFNAIPRAPIKQIMEAYWVHSADNDMWHNALKLMKRQFKVCGSLFEGLLSTTGYPEGDAISVAVMALLSVLWHDYVLSKAIVDPYAYVDNWEVTAEDVRQTMIAGAACTIFRVHLDSKLLRISAGLGQSQRMTDKCPKTSN